VRTHFCNCSTLYNLQSGNKRLSLIGELVCLVHSVVYRSVNTPFFESIHRRVHWSMFLYSPGRPVSQRVRSHSPMHPPMGGCDFASPFLCTYYVLLFSTPKKRPRQNDAPVHFFGASFHHGLIFLRSRVAVIRGQVLSPQGLGIIGVRVSVDSKPKNGFTLTRPGGW
jgi:hypothetical protein